MPKIIENVREQLLAEVKRQIAAHGYAATTVRSVARACGLGTGTVYNYFSSKEMIVATYVAEDWRLRTEELRRSNPQGAEETLRALYDMLNSFAGEHRALFTDPDAVKVFVTIFSERHGQLRSQLAEFLLPVCAEKQNPDFLAQFIAESLLTWTMAGTRFDELYPILQTLISQ